MLGVPGCGKSLCAKAVAADWQIPLLRLDPGVLYQKYIGESENQLRQAIQQAEAMAPVVLWIDEIEKAFASATSSSADGGLSQRMFGTLLSWMQDHREPIFIVAAGTHAKRPLRRSLLYRPAINGRSPTDLRNPPATTSEITVIIRSGCPG
jgi:SpoVK/Ycf46/Vps4 family AAA+-type ATPase